MWEFDLVFLLDFFLHSFDDFFDFWGELLDLLFKAGHFLYFFKVIDVDDVGAKIIKKVHFGILFFSFFLILLFFFVFLNLKFFQECGLILSLKFIIKITDFFSSFFINEHIVKISEVGKMSN